MLHRAATIDIAGTSLTGDLSITASTTTIVHLDALHLLGGSITTMFFSSITFTFNFNKCWNYDWGAKTLWI